MGRAGQPSHDAWLRVIGLGEQFDAAWRAGQRPQIEDYLQAAPVELRSDLFSELLARERRCKGGAEDFNPALYLARFAEYESRVEAEICRVDGHPGADRPASPTITGPFARHVSAGVDSVQSQNVEDTDVIGEDLPEPAGTGQVPTRIDRFLIERRLGEGRFGCVYLAQDAKLRRPVALKVARSTDFSSERDLGSFLDEARAAARLSHPGIVTVHDVGRADADVYIVQEYLGGGDLSAYLQSPPRPAEWSAEVVRAVAEAVSFAHQKGIVHRDLKPSNILFGEDGSPRVADFGLALHESVQNQHSGEYCGTPPYMSPEQVRGEAHRLDGRSDIWALGVILYELLTGTRPFHGETRVVLWDEIKHRHPKPPRMIRPDLPVELERICLKCLGKRVTERYSTASDLAEDLRMYLAGETPQREGGLKARPKQIVPKGLRSFGAEDADFFLDLLPGPRDRNGLPENIRFWESHIQERASDQTFAVGVLCGPSGCGKSSLVRAGLLPRLGSSVVPVYVEATRGDTEARLLRSLRAQFPDLPPERSLSGVLKMIREDVQRRRQKKVLLILDQFEQWLHARHGGWGGELLEALRQCDGGGLQCILMVRDDFWLATSRAMELLEIDAVLGKNAVFVELFDLRHAREVLTDFGRAYACLPEGELSGDHAAFIEQAVQGLAEDDKVICVRLALFADMIKSKPWTTATLKQVGGADGLGVAFLEETFCAAAAPAGHRYHQRAAKALLQALLPERSDAIKGRMRSSNELLTISGYEGRPERFRELLRILEHEVRLITPTDPDGMDAGSEPPAPGTSEKYYQLTHDYLIPSISCWLAGKQSLAARLRGWCQHPNRILQAGIGTVMVAGTALLFHLAFVALPLLDSEPLTHVMPTRFLMYFLGLAALADLPYLLFGLNMLRKSYGGVAAALAWDAIFLAAAALFVIWPDCFPAGIHLYGAPQVRANWVLIGAVISTLTISHLLALIAAHADWNARRHRHSQWAGRRP